MKNISLYRYKQRFFGDFLELPGLTEIAVNRFRRTVHKNQRSVAATRRSLVL